MARIYINPNLTKRTATLLRQFQIDHPDEQYPMLACANVIIAQSKENGIEVDVEELTLRYYRAAKRLGWDVVKSRGAIYENGLQVWNTYGNSEKEAAN